MTNDLAKVDKEPVIEISSDGRWRKITGRELEFEFRLTGLFSYQQKQLTAGVAKNNLKNRHLFQLEMVLCGFKTLEKWTTEGSRRYGLSAKKVEEYYEAFFSEESQAEIKEYMNDPLAFVNSRSIKKGTQDEGFW